MLIRSASCLSLTGLIERSLLAGQRPSEKLPKGNQENNGCIPHHIVWDLPGDAENGIDRQLEKAVEVLLDELD